MRIVFLPPHWQQRGLALHINKSWWWADAAFNDLPASRLAVLHSTDHSSLDQQRMCV